MMTSKLPNYEISELSIVVAVAEQISSDIGGESVILNLKTGTYHGLNEVGARVWDLIQQPLAVKDLHETLMQEYEVKSEICKNDLLALLDDLQAAGLIEVQDEISK